MKEIEHILHAFLLLLAGLIVFISIKTVVTSGQDETASKDILVNELLQIPTPSRGKELFIAKCASCHIIGRDFTGPSLCGFETRGPWGERENVYKWIRNPKEFMLRFEYAQDLGNSYAGMMMSFPELTDEEIDEIINYINTVCGNLQRRAVARAN